MYRFRLAAAASALAIAHVSTPAFAADEDAAEAAIADDGAFAGDSGDGLDAIVVTATKRETN